MNSTDSIVVINAGSSSIKFSLYDGAALELAMRGKIENLYAGVSRFVAQEIGRASCRERVF